MTKIKVYNQKDELEWEDEIDDMWGNYGMTSIGYSYHPKKNPRSTIIINFNQYKRFEIIEEN